MLKMAIRTKLLLMLFLPVIIMAVIPFYILHSNAKKLDQNINKTNHLGVLYEYQVQLYRIS